MKFLLPLFLMVLLNHLSFSQPDISPRVIPPSPEASNLGKFAETPVSLYTGVPSISIPIYELQAGVLKLPISLDYHASGIKVEEMASWVGIGWALNAGGLVTRTVRGKPDDTDYGNGFFRYSPGRTPMGLATLMGPPRAAALQELCDNTSDPEPDQYFINVNGITASFTFGWDGSLVQDQNKKLLITKIQDTGNVSNPYKILGWQVVDDQGNIYKFMKTETTNSDPPGALAVNKNGTFTSSWYITEMKDACNDNSIIFTYDPYTLDYGYKASMSTINPRYGDGGGPCVPIPVLNTSLSRTVIQGQRISEITTSNGVYKISFVPGFTRTDTEQISSGGATTNFKSLDYILIKNVNQEEIKKFKLGYDYSVGRLTLKTVTPQQGSANLSPPYSMSYYSSLPSALSYAQDHWGYHNGQTGNTNLLPAMWADLGYPNGKTFLAGANREPNSTFLPTGSLIKIQYPTDGYTEFDFEPHDYGYIQANSVLRYGIDNLSYGLTMTEAEIVGTNYSKNTSFVINADPIHPSDKIPITLNWSVFTDAATLAKKPWVKIYKTTDVNNPILSLIFGIQDPNYVQSDNATMTLDPGTYVMEVGCKAFADVNDFATLNVAYSNYNSTVYKTKPSGGLRIKEIRQFSSSTDPNFSTRQFKYVLSAESDRSSGVIYQEPSYGYDHWVFCSPSPGEQYFAHAFSRLTTNATILGSTQGSHIGYREVQTIYGNGVLINGKNISKFTSPFEITDTIFTELPFRPANTRGFKTGLLIEETIYKYESGTYNPVSKTQNTYASIQSLVQGFKALFLGDKQLDTHYMWGIYSDYFGKSVLTQSIQTSYDNQSSNPIITTKQIFYDPYLNNVIRTTQKISNNPLAISENYYPKDFLNPTVAIAQLTARNMVGIPLETIRKQVIAGVENITSGEFNEYNLVSTNPRLFRKLMLNVASPISSGFNYAFNNSTSNPDSRYEEVIKFNSYDAYGNLTQFTQLSGVANSYKWGYGNSLPIAQIINANIADVFYTSFEEDVSSISTTFATGSKSHDGAYTVNIPGTGTRKLTYWKKVGANPWQLVETTINNTTTIGAIGTLIDEVRVYPPSAQITTYTYKQGTGLSSVTDQNNVISYYEYDTAGRLYQVKDESLNLLKRMEYHYKNGN